MAKSKRNIQQDQAGVPKSLYRTDDVGLMVALVNLPFHEPLEFARREFFDGIFKRYKDAVRDRFDQPRLKGSALKKWQDYEREFQKDLYRCAAFCLFGRMDIAMICLVDDFELAIRDFRPFNPLLACNGGEDLDQYASYDYQVITGPSPVLTGKPGLASRNILKQARQTFLRSSEDAYAYVGICQLKLNNSFVIGTGGSVAGCALELIHSIVHRKRPRQGKVKIELDAVVVESFGFHEFTVLFFSNSLVEIAQTVLQIKECTFSQLLDQKILDKDKYERLKKRTFCHRVFEEKKLPISEYDHCHLFIGVHTTFGYNVTEQIQRGKETDAPSSFLKNVAAEQIKLHTRWTVRTGHLEAALKTLDQLGVVGACLALDQGDVVICKSNDSLPPPQALDILKKTKDAISPHLRKIRSHLEIKVDKNIRGKLPSFSEDRQFLINEALRRELGIPFADIVQLKENLQKLGVPKMVIHRLWWICSTFNHRMQDPMLYGFFVELDGFLRHKVLPTAQNFARNTGKPGYQTYHLTDLLYDMTETFLKAYGNRFFGSFHFKEVSDFKADYTGGIQQLSSAYDSLYKALCYPFGEKDFSVSFAHVEGAPGIASKEHAIRLNYYHVFQPAMFLSVAGHEAANFFIDKLLKGFAKLKESDPANPPPYSTWVKDYLDFDADKLHAQLARIGYDFPRPFPKNGAGNHADSLLFHPFNRQLHPLDSLLPFPDFEPFLDHLESELYTYFIVDLITFYYSYNSDPDLFYFWHWHHFLQLSDAYVSADRLTTHTFITMFLRIGVIVEASQPGFLDQHPLSPAPDIMRALWQRFYADGVKFIRAFLQIEQVKEWFQFMEDLAKRVVLVAHGRPGETFPGEPGRLEEIIRQVESEKGNIQQKLKIGEVFRYRQQGSPEWTKAEYARMLVYAYLDLIYHWADGKPITLLPREKNDGRTQTPIPSEFVADLAFDPLGGIFAHDPQVRREYFRVRTTMMKSMWDMGMVEKMNLFPFKK